MGRVCVALRAFAERERGETLHDGEAKLAAEIADEIVLALEGASGERLVEALRRRNERWSGWTGTKES